MYRVEGGWWGMKGIHQIDTTTVQGCRLYAGNEALGLADHDKIS